MAGELFININWHRGFIHINFDSQYYWIGLVISQIPEDYFIHEKRQADNWDKYSSETRVVIIIVKNVIGILMLISGLLLLILPGQGILTMIIGILLIDYPGKFKLEQKIISIPSVFRGLNWFRAKSKKT